MNKYFITEISPSRETEAVDVTGWDAETVSLVYSVQLYNVNSRRLNSL